MGQLAVYELILILLALAALGTARLVFHMERRRGLTRHAPLLGDGWSGTVGYASAVVAFLLGLMLFFSINTFSTAQGVASDEAIAYSSAFDAAQVLPATSASTIERDLVCLMRATRSGSWHAMSLQDLTGDDNVTAWYRQTLKDVSSTSATDKGVDGTVSTIQNAVNDAGRARQQRLLSVRGELPLAIWIIIYVSIYVMLFLFALVLIDNPVLVAVSLLACTVLTGAAVAALVMFSEPFSDPGVKVQPTAISGVLVRLESDYPGPEWAECPTLAVYQDRSSITSVP